jgi:diacylglycerol kinase family enzyme
LSDVNAKKDIHTIEGALEKTLALRGVDYVLKETQQKQVGVIAQEVEQILPEVVSTSSDGTKSVSYGNIVGLLIEAIKEQQKQIDELKKLLEK